MLNRLYGTINTLIFTLIDKEHTVYNFRLDPTLGANTLSMEPEQKAKISFHDWKKAFNIFQA